MDRITVPHTVSAVIVSVADSLSPLCDALLGSNERAEFKVTFEMKKPFIMIEKVLYFLEEVVCKTVSDFFYELPQTSSDYGLRNKMSLIPYTAS